MKKLICVLILVVMFIVLGACGSNNDTATANLQVGEIQNIPDNHSLHINYGNGLSMILHDDWEVLSDTDMGFTVRAELDEGIGFMSILNLSDRVFLDDDDPFLGDYIIFNNIVSRSAVGTFTVFEIPKNTEVFGRTITYYGFITNVIADGIRSDGAPRIVIMLMTENQHVIVIGDQLSDVVGDEFLRNEFMDFVASIRFLE